MTILRTRTQGCWELKENSWGRFLAPSVDPDADAVITDEQLEAFELKADIPKINGQLWNRWVALCMEMTKRNTANLEVSCRLLRNADGDYRILVPEQTVTVASVRVDSFDKAIDIETGEVVTQWPPEGWNPCGSSHSHNTMDAFFSGTDDQYELGDPGLHIVVGRIDTAGNAYKPLASITANKRRFIVDFDAVIDQQTEAVMYHPAVLTAINLPKAPTMLTYRPSVPSSLPYWDDMSWEDDMFFGGPEIARHQELDLVEEEMNMVRRAVDKLVVAAMKADLNVPRVINDLVFDIEEQTETVNNYDWIT